MLINRIGDLGLTLAMCVIFVTFRSLDYSVVFALVPCVVNTNITLFGFSVDRLTLISILLFCGAIGKSAQIGLHV